jgi:hypothetical protein
LEKEAGGESWDFSSRHIYGREFHINKYHGPSKEDIVSQPLPADRFSDHKRGKMRQ